ncbi:Senescence regulator S40 [Macleaya cordata]|uniref:Senescence regulator S40 n=1 Tax=Macleaya cordata TaxID=56857 RepID=A0A200QID2_MACCD|nr:Senescence regulator S40 [Macleaya cordata]
MAAARKNYLGLAKTSHRFLSVERESHQMNSDTMFEFDEADIWKSNQVASPDQYKKPIRSSKVLKKSSKIVPNNDRSGGTAASLPVNIPDWSKILRQDQRDNQRRDYNDDESDDDGDDNRIPPHEFLARQFARTRIASFSVHEGVGRTLKGRDLSRVRDAIWEKTGFED